MKKHTEQEIRGQMKLVADALWALRGVLNEGDADPASQSKTVAASVLESFASYASCVASEGRFDTDTFAGLEANLLQDFNACEVCGMIDAGNTCCD